MFFLHRLRAPTEPHGVDPREGDAAEEEGALQGDAQAWSLITFERASSVLVRTDLVDSNSASSADTCLGFRV